MTRRAGHCRIGSRSALPLVRRRVLSVPGARPWPSVLQRWLPRAGAPALATRSQSPWPAIAARPAQSRRQSACVSGAITR